MSSSHNAVHLSLVGTPRPGTQLNQLRLHQSLECEIQIYCYNLPQQFTLSTHRKQLEAELITYALEKESHDYQASVFLSLSHVQKHFFHV